MTTMNPLLAGIEQLLLPVILLMTLVGMIGGKSDAVLRPIFELLTRLMVGLMGLLCTVIAALFKALVAVLPHLVRAAGSAASTASGRKIR